MKWLVLLLILISGSVLGQTPFKGSDYMFYYQVNVGKTNGTLTTPSAWLEIGKDSTTKGFRLPRVVDTANISNPVFGLYIYQIKDNGVYFRDKFGWRRQADATILNSYLLKSDSTLYYPYSTNPKNYIITELDPNANARTLKLRQGAGILINDTTPRLLSTNPIWIVSAKVDSPLWNANKIQGAAVSATPPTSGQVLQYNGSQYIPVTFGGGGGGAVTSVGLAMPPIFTVTNSPVITSGTLTAAFNNQFANLVLASPNGSSGQPTFRSLTNTDLPTSAVSPGNYGNDTAYVNFSVNSKGVVTNASTIPLTLDRALRGGNSSNRKLFLGDTTGSLRFGLNTDYGAVRFFSTGDNDGSSNLVLESGDNAGMSPLEGFLFLRDSTDNSVPGIRHYDTTLALNGLNAKFSTPLVAPAPTYSAGGITAVGRNNTTGRFETFTAGSTPNLQAVTDAGNQTTDFTAFTGFTSPLNITATHVGFGDLYTGNPVAGTFSQQDIEASFINIKPSRALAVISGDLSPSTFNTRVKGLNATTSNDFITKAQLDSLAGKVPTGFAFTSDANYTIQATDKFILLIQTTALRTLTLPSPSGVAGKELWIRCAATGSGQWQTGTLGFINCGQIGTPPFSPVTNQPFNSNTTTHLISDGTNWNCFQ